MFCLLFASCRTTRDSSELSTIQDRFGYKQICTTSMPEVNFEFHYLEPFVDVSVKTDSLTYRYIVKEDGFTLFPMTQTGKRYTFFPSMSQYVAYYKMVRDYWLKEDTSAPQITTWVKQKFVSVSDEEYLSRDNFYISLYLKLLSDRKFMVQFGFDPNLSPSKPVYLPSHSHRFFRSPLPFVVSLQGNDSHGYKEEIEYYFENRRILKRYKASKGSHEFRVACGEPQKISLSEVAPLDINSIEKNERLMQQLNHQLRRTILSDLAVMYTIERFRSEKKVELDMISNSSKIMCTDFLKEVQKDRTSFTKERMAELFQSHVLDHQSFQMWSLQIQRALSRVSNNKDKLTLETIVWNACIAHHFPNFKKSN